MSLLASIAFAASGVILPHCAWNKPGVNPFMGDLVTAVASYQDIPAAARARLMARMQKHDFDDNVSIKAKSIEGKARYGAEIRDMHFGASGLCKTVTRDNWLPSAEERGLVYCEGEHCILVPAVCRNVSRIRRSSPHPAAVAPDAERRIASSSRDTDASQTPLEIDPPSAGPLSDASATNSSSFAQIAGSGSGMDVDGSTTLAPAPAGGIGLGAGPSPGLQYPPALPPGRVAVTPPVPPAVPEPSASSALLAGLLSLALFAWRRSRVKS